jgi:Ran GTPase-activating protein (RanGAP) involved in mRNA processing and transport
MPDIKLVELDLSMNLITDIGITKLCEGLTKNQYLKTLNLDSNQIKHEGYLALAEYLKGDKIL